MSESYEFITRQNSYPWHTRMLYVACDPYGDHYFKQMNGLLSRCLCGQYTWEEWCEHVNTTQKSRQAMQNSVHRYPEDKPPTVTYGITQSSGIQRPVRGVMHYIECPKYAQALFSQPITSSCICARLARE